MGGRPSYFLIEFLKPDVLWVLLPADSTMPAHCCTVESIIFQTWKTEAEVLTSLYHRTQPLTCYPYLLEEHPRSWAQQSMRGASISVLSMFITASALMSTPHSCCTRGCAIVLGHFWELLCYSGDGWSATKGREWASRSLLTPKISFESSVP